jgi:hypothetical protein
MALIHVIKLTEGEAVLKCYCTDSNGGTINIGLQEWLTRPNEVFNPVTARVSIRGIYWGVKPNKSIDITRVISPTEVHGHYYLTGAGSYDFPGFVDNVYAEKDLRIIADGPFHVTLVLSKLGWQNKIEEWRFGSYDNPAAVGE